MCAAAARFMPRKLGSLGTSILSHGKDETQYFLLVSVPSGLSILGGYQLYHSQVPLVGFRITHIMVTVYIGQFNYILKYKKYK